MLTVNAFYLTAIALMALKLMGYIGLSWWVIAGIALVPIVWSLALVWFLTVYVIRNERK